MSAANRVNTVVGHLSANNTAAVDPSRFSDVVQAPPNEIFNTKALFKKDTSSVKMNLGVGAYRTNEGKPLVLSAVRKAERLMAHDDSLNHEYLGMTGDATFCKVAQKLMFGANSPAIRENRIATVQSISGTGALRLGAESVKRFFKGSTVYYSNPSWGNHGAIFRNAGVKASTYRYWNPVARKLDIEGMLEDLNKAPKNSIILMHACAHNPTGVDPTPAEWRRIANVMKHKKLFPFFDSAYQGFATGNLEQDAYAVRFFVEQGFSMIVSQSFAKNFGLYSERCGTLSVVTPSAKTAAAVKSQIALIVRPMYSNPPAHGARVVTRVLSDPALYKEWEQELVSMSVRIQEMRQALYKELQNLETPGTWEHIITQIGMFSFTGLSEAQCAVMVSKWHVYLLKNGRISMSGINTGNVKHLAKAIDDVVRNVRK